MAENNSKSDQTTRPEDGRRCHYCHQLPPAAEGKRRVDKNKIGDKTSLFCADGAHLHGEERLRGRPSRRSRLELSPPGRAEAPNSGTLEICGEICIPAAREAPSGGLGGSGACGAPGKPPPWTEGQSGLKRKRERTSTNQQQPPEGWFPASLPTRTTFSTFASGRRRKRRRSPC